MEPPRWGHLWEMVLSLVERSSLLGGLSFFSIIIPMQVSFKVLLNIWDNYNIFAITYAPIIRFYDYYNN